MSFLGGTGKSRTNTGPTNIAQLGYRQFNNQVGSPFISQLGEMLRTGGIGAQTPIVAQSVGAAQSALSQALTGQQGQLAASGLARTPYGQQQLGQTRLAGLQGISQIPTQYAQQQIAQVPDLYKAVLGSIASSTNARTGSYAT